MKPSIYRRLLVVLSLLFMGSILCATVLAVRSAHHNIDNDYDAQLIAESHAVLMFVHEDLEENGKLDNYKLDSDVLSFLPAEKSTLHEYIRWRGFRIWKGDAIEAKSESLKDVEMPKSPSGFSDVVVGADKWRVYAIYMPKMNIVVETMENLSNRDRLMGGIIEEMTEPALVFLPLMALLLMGAIRFGLTGVSTMTAQIGRRAPNDLAAVKTQNLPQELQPLEDALNSLLARLKVSIAHEREFIDNAAHELRTPLAALRLQGQLVTEAPTDADRRENATSLIATIDRTTSLFEQMLTLSRIQNHEMIPQTVKIADMIRAVVTDRALLPADKDIDVSMDGHEAITVHTQPDMFKIMLGVLVDNAIKYTPAGGKIALDYDAGHVRVTDSGPGIPDTEKEKVFERFYRVRGDNGHGSGLGLAIAKHVCDVLGIGIRLENGPEGRGLAAVVVLKDENAQRAG